LRGEDYFKLVATILTFISFLFMAVVSEIEGQILGVVLLALVLWSLYPRHHFISSLFIISLLSLFQASISPREFIRSLFSTYGGSGLWIIISGFILSEGMDKSGLARRIALWIITGLGGDPNKVVLSVAIASLAVAPLSPSTTAKAFLILPICIGLIQAFDVEKGQSPYGAGVMIMAMAANNICSTGFLTATVPNPISAEYIRDSSNLDLGWFEWLKMSLPLTLILLASSWLVCRKMFKPEVEARREAVKRIGDLLNEMGPISRRELLVASVFSIALFLWITERIHGLNSGLISLALSLFLFIPQTGSIKIDGFMREVPWGSITLFAASMFLAKAVGRWRALDPVTRNIFELLNVSSLPILVFVVLIVLISTLLHVAFTSTTVYATVMVPLSISLARLQGLEPQFVGIPVAFLAPVALILPVNTIPNVVFYSSGYFNQKQMIVYGIVVSLISIFLTIFIGLPYWINIGFM